MCEKIVYSWVQNVVAIRCKYNLEIDGGYNSVN